MNDEPEDTEETEEEFYCYGCGWRCLKDTCHCGSSYQQHSYSDHSFVSSGCTCGYLTREHDNPNKAKRHKSTIDPIKTSTWKVNGGDRKCPLCGNATLMYNHGISDYVMCATIGCNFYEKPPTYSAPNGFNK